MAQKWGAKFKAMAPAQQEAVNEKLMTTPMLLDALATQFEKAGKTAEARSMRSAAAASFKTIFGADPASVTIDPAGRIGGLGGGTKTARGAGRAPSPLPTGPLAASLSNGARVFVKYGVPGTGGFDYDELVLFPDGTAFNELPSGPTPRFDVASLRAAVKPVYVGRWAVTGNRLTLTFGGKRETFVKDPSGGWADPELRAGSFGIYFPVKIATRAQLAGSWKSKSLVVMGTAGGGSPMVAGGRNQDLTFAANGTFVKAGKSFASATTANMGDAFKGGGDVTSASTGKSGGRGQWRLDGVLLTTVENGRRGVQLAYILPKWGKPTDPPEIMIQSDRWSRPGRD